MVFQWGMIALCSSMRWNGKRDFRQSVRMGRESFQDVRSQDNTWSLTPIMEKAVCVWE